MASITRSAWKRSHGNLQREAAAESKLKHERYEKRYLGTAVLVKGPGAQAKKSGSAKTKLKNPAAC